MYPVRQDRRSYPFEQFLLLLAYFVALAACPLLRLLHHNDSGFAVAVRGY